MLYMGREMRQCAPARLTSRQNMPRLRAFVFVGVAARTYRVLRARVRSEFWGEN